MEAFIVEKTLLCKYDIDRKKVSYGWLIYFDYKQHALMYMDAYSPEYVREKGIKVVGVFIQTLCRKVPTSPEPIVSEAGITQSQLDEYTQECMKWALTVYNDYPAPDMLTDLQKLAICLSVVSYLHDIEFKIFDMNLYPYFYNAHRQIHQESMKVVDQESGEMCDLPASSTEETETYPHYVAARLEVRESPIHEQQQLPKESVLVWISEIFQDIYALSAA